MRPTVAGRPQRAATSPIAAAVVIALLLVGVGSIVAPRGVLAGTPMTACAAVNLRTSASTSDPTNIVATVAAGAQVTVEATVADSPWTASCAGNAVSGNSWYLISELNGQAVASLYGVPFVYGATGLFQAPSAPPPSPDPSATSTATPDPFASPSASPDPFASPSPTPSPSPLRSSR